MPKNEETARARCPFRCRIGREVDTLSVKRIAGGASLILVSHAAIADSVALSVGAGDEAELVAVVLQFDRRKPLKEYDASKLTGHLELAVGYAHGNAKFEDNKRLAAVGITPVLRLERPRSDVDLFLECGIGTRFLSDTRIYGSRAFSTAFQFGELIGVGLRFGPRQAYELGLRLEHVSNGGIKQPNDGIEFAAIRLGYHYN